MSRNAASSNVATIRGGVARHASGRTNLHSRTREGGRGRSRDVRRRAVAHGEARRRSLMQTAQPGYLAARAKNSPDEEECDNADEPCLLHA